MNNKQTVGQRFSQLIQALGMSKNAFALSLDKTATVIQHIVEERNKPGFDLLCKVFEIYPNVSKEWILQGIGSMFSNEKADSGEGLNAIPAAEKVAAIDTPVTAAAPSAKHIEQIVTSISSSSANDSAPVTEPAPVAAPLPPAAPPTPNWEAALYAQQLQHQLALAELRNQHLLEQQKMLQQMVELLRR